jgi:hypothetical protein
MANEKNLKKFTSEYQPEKKGRPKGVKNRSTIARYWLNIIEKTDNPITGNTESLSQEDLLTLAQIKKAREGDTSAYKALMDSTYGAPIQQIEQNTTQIDLSDITTEEIKKLLKE